jgi:putative salt-induced outer membrane protein YdiY
VNNGDRITGKVKGLQDGVLKVDLDYVDGAISVDWRKVLKLNSNALYIVRLKDGSVHSGKLVSPKTSITAHPQIEISDEQRRPMVVDNSEVVRIVPTSESLLNRFSGSVTSGTQYSKGNSTTQYSIRSELSYRETNWGAGVSYASGLSASTGAKTSTRNEVSFLSYRLLPWKNYFYAGSAGFLQSSVQGIQRQTNLGVGMGRYLKNTNRFRFTIMGGLGWQGTRYVPIAQTQQSQNLAVGLLVANLDAFSFKSTRFNLQASLAPSLTESGREFTKINASYYIKIFGKIDWNLSFYGNWDTKPPAHLQNSDYGSTTGLSYTFGNK